MLEIVRSKQPVTCADLSRVYRLPPSTVSNIVDQLLQKRWIVEGALARRPKRRRPTMLALNDNLVMLVADLRPRKAKRSAGSGKSVGSIAFKSHAW